MFRLTLITFFALGCNAGGGYGGQTIGGQLGGGYGGGLSSGYGGGLGGYGGLNGYAQQQVIDVDPQHVPVQVHFRTSGSKVNVHQSHTPGVQGQVEHASFQDEPHRVIHEVVKPVIQEVREIIQPYRRVTQEIRPVIEEVHTVVHKGEGRRGGQQLNGGGGYGNGGGLVSSNGYKSAKGRARA